MAEYYKPLAQEVIILSRKASADHENCKTIVWDGKTPGEWIDRLNGSDLLINLCGKNVNCRYTKKNKADIINSRIIPIRLLDGAIEVLENVPHHVFKNSGWISFYLESSDDKSYAQELLFLSYLRITLSGAEAKGQFL